VAKVHAFLKKKSMPIIQMGHIGGVHAYGLEVMGHFHANGMR